MAAVTFYSNAIQADMSSGWAIKVVPTFWNCNQCSNTEEASMPVDAKSLFWIFEQCKSSYQPDRL